MSIDKFDNLSTTPPADATKLATPPAAAQEEKAEGINIDYLQAAEESLQANPDFMEIFQKVQGIANESKNQESKEIAALFALFVSSVSLRISSLEEQVEDGMSDDVAAAFEEIETLAADILAASESNKPGLKAIIKTKVSQIRDIVSSQLGEEEDLWPRGPSGASCLRTQVS